MDVSVIIPTFNRLWSLPKAIESCRNTICKTEIIVVDDGSRDETWEWLQTQNDIVIIKQNNWGKCWAVNNGFQISKGKYIRFLDADDILSENTIDEQFNIAETENADVVVSGYENIDINDHTIRKQKWIYCDDFMAQQLGECDSSHYSSYLFKKEIIKDIPHRPDFAFRDDRLFVLELALKHPVVSYHNGYALKHRIHSNDRLQKTDGLKSMVQNFQHFNIYKKIVAELIKRNEFNLRRANACNKILWPLAHWIAKENIQEAQKVVDFIYELNSEFQIPESGYLKILYNKLGFKATERLLKLRRVIKSSFTS